MRRRVGEDADGVHDPAARARRPLVALLAASTLFTLGDGSVQILLSPHLQAQGLADGTIGPVVAAYSVAALCFRFVTGAAYRAHRVRRLVVGGCLLQSVAFLGIANASHSVLLTALIALNGAGFALASTGGLAAVMELRKGSNAGAIMGWYTGCIGLGYAVANFTGGFVGDLLGLSTAIITLGVVPLIAAGGFTIALRTPHGPSVDQEAAAASDGSTSRTGSSHDDPPTCSLRLSPRAAIRRIARLGPMVFLAFLCALHINLLSGVLLTYFPLYALALGLSLTQIGLLAGLHSAVGASIRFVAPALFKVVSYRRLLPWMVGLGSIGTAALVISPVFAVLAIAWAVIGLSRGILRVASSALVMDHGSETEQDRGVASGVYMSGLDIGRIVGPMLGGAAAHAFDYATTLVLAGVGVPMVFLTMNLWLRLRSGDPARHGEPQGSDG